MSDEATDLMLCDLHRGMLMRALNDHYLIVKFNVDMKRAESLAKAGLLECRTNAAWHREYVPTQAAKDMLA